MEKITKCLVLIAFFAYSAKCAYLSPFDRDSAMDENDAYEADENAPMDDSQNGEYGY